MMPITLGTASNQPEKIDMSDDRIVTNAMLHAERLDRIEQLEAELAKVQEEAAVLREWQVKANTALAAEKVRADAMFATAEKLEAELAKVKAERDAAVAFTAQNHIDTLAKRRDGFAGQSDYLYAFAEPTGEYTVPLYATPPAAAERIALLEGLLREISKRVHLGSLSERIRAALEEG